MIGTFWVLVCNSGVRVTLLHVYEKSGPKGGGGAWPMARASGAGWWPSGAGWVTLWWAKNHENHEFLSNIFFAHWDPKMLWSTQKHIFWQLGDHMAPSGGDCESVFLKDLRGGRF